MQREFSLNWLVPLSGNSIILYNLQRMNSPHFSIFDDSDDHLAEQYFLKSSHFTSNENAEEVYSAACGLVQLINGAAAIDWGFNNYSRRGSIQINDIFFTSVEIPRDSDWVNARVEKKHPASNPFIGEMDKSHFLNPFSNKTTSYIELCLEYEDVFHLLRQVSVGFDWRNLYCIWDTICHYSGGVKNTIKTLELDEVKIKAFTGTVNNFEILGLEARHGVMGWKIPKNTVNHEEAINIVGDVVSRYLKNKVCLGCKSKEWNKQFNKQMNQDK